jgi:hypothetical protein
MNKGIGKNPGDGGDESVLFNRYTFAVPLVLIVTTTLLIYYNTFQSPFVFDDEIYILDNAKIRNLGNFLDISGTRYIAFLTFALNYAVGGYNTFGYHLVNIVIHAINGLLIWWLVLLTFETPKMGQVGGNSQVRYFIALTASLIFISHPVQTQAVTYITQRFTSLATLFYLLSIVLYIKTRFTATAGSPKGKWFFYSASLLSAVLAMKTKEISFTLPFIIVLYEFAFFKDKTPNIKRLFYLIPFFFTLAIIPLTLFAPELGLGERGVGIDEKIRWWQIKDLTYISRHDYLLTQFRVIMTYLRLLVFPVNQNADYDYPIFHSILDPQVFLSFLFVLSIFGSAIYIFIRSRKTGNGYALLASFGILWFFITLSVESSIIPIRDVIFEHRLYLPTVGAVIAFPTGIFYLFEYRKMKNFVVATFLLLLFTAVPLGVSAYSRNLVWKDGITLWKDVARKNPWNSRAHNNIGTAYAKQGLIDEAIAEYREALRLKPDLADLADVHFNLALAYKVKGLKNEALREFEKGLKIRPNDEEARKILETLSKQ